MELRVIWLFSWFISLTLMFVCVKIKKIFLIQVKVLFNLRRLTVFFLDTLIFFCVYFSVYFIFTMPYINHEISIDFNVYLLNMLFFYVAIFATRLLLSIYSNIWRYATYRTYLKMLLADGIGAAVALLITIFFNKGYLDIVFLFENIIFTFNIFTIFNFFTEY